MLLVFVVIIVVVVIVVVVDLVEVVVPEIVIVVVDVGVVIVVVPVVFVDVAGFVVILVGSEDPVPISYLDRAVANEANAVVVTQVLELLNVAIDLAALAALNDLAHGVGCRVGADGPGYVPMLTLCCLQGNALIRVSCVGPRLSFRARPADERGTVSKSVLTLVAIGIVGAVLMSLVMRHLVEVAAERERSPYAAAVETRLGTKRVGPVKLEELAVGENVRIVVSATVMAGFNKQKLADSAGQEVWLGALRKGARLDEVVVVLGDDDQGSPETFVVPAPTTRR